MAGEGLSLVKGVQVTLQAVALSIKADGNIESLEIGGRLGTEGSHVTTLEIEGAVGSCRIDGGVRASGEGSDAVHLIGDAPNLDGLALTAEHGELIRRTAT